MRSMRGDRRSSIRSDCHGKRRTGKPTRFAGPRSTAPVGVKGFVMASAHINIDRNMVRNLTITVTIGRTTKFWMHVGLFFIKLGARIAHFGYRREHVDDDRADA